MADASVLAPLPFVLSFCSLQELQHLSQVSRDVSSTCNPEWRLRTIARFGDLRFVTSQWRRCFLLRSQFRRKAVESVTARVYLMNNRGETRFFPIERGTPLILMASVAALRGSLNFESELFQIFPAPVLLDTNSLLRVTHKFKDEEDTEFLQSPLMMMQVWASIDGLVYRPLAPPSTIQETPDRVQEVGENVEETATYALLKLHELSGMTISIDDNTLRYRLQGDELCVNALISNTYLLYLFNPLQYRPLDWTFDAMLQVGDERYVLPVQREGVFLNTTSYALRVFLSYGKLPEKPLPNGTASENQEQENASVEVASAAAESATPSTSGSRGAENSDPLEIPYDGQREIFAFHLTATNRISKKTTDRRLRQMSIESTSTWSEDEEEASDTNPADTAPQLERHVHLPFDAMICYCFAPSCRLQYVEFAIGFEPLMHLLGVADFLPDAVAAC
ncbi:hypothetical protein DVH05_027189 [Phytophthora capsici]|nr:hypothetical protein DVH05_027189 [Phytophthora capsici]|eukprot:jgi/Phyca11/4267/fgenesh1_pm.PHYCAscaffold_1_\